METGRNVKIAADDGQTRFFFELTPSRILDASEALGVRCTGRCLALNSMENRVYEVEIEVSDHALSARSPQRFRVVKFYRPGRWTYDQILEEHEFLLDLKKNDIPVVTPLSFPDGKTIRYVDNFGIFYAVFDKIAGRIADELNDDGLRRLGRLLARVHNSGAQRVAKHRLTLDADTYGLQNLEFILQSGMLPPEIAPLYRQTVESICAIAKICFDGVALQRIHGDCHLGNILDGPEGLFLVDFDDMLCGPVVQDLWLVAGGRGPESRQRLDKLLEGYTEMRHFDSSTLALIEPLRALRYIHFTAWIARRWHDPAFPATFPHFGSMQYWKEQVADLQEQLMVVQGAEV